MIKLRQLIIFYMFLILMIGTVNAVTSPQMYTSQKYFPASECTNINQTRCNDNYEINATFNLTYTVGSNNLTGGLKIAFGWAEINKTKGFYSYKSRALINTNRKQTWGEPKFQNTSPASLNYVTVSTTNSSVGVIITSIPYDGLNLIVNDTLYEGDNITIQFINISQPGIPVETDLMVLEDTNNEGIYQHVVERYTDVTEYPQLIVTGFNLTGFTIYAPSRTNGTEFNITAIAMDKKTKLYNSKSSPSYIIRNYTGTISFSSSDPNAILPSDYTFTLADRGTHIFNVTLNTTGIQNITINSSSITGVSNPISVNDSDYNNYQIYWWGRHVHTSFSHDGSQTPTWAYNYAQEDWQLDVFSLSDHCQSVENNWTYQRDLPAQYSNNYFVALNGYEYGRNSIDGHRNIIFKNSTNTTVYCSVKYNNDPAIIAGYDVWNLSDMYYNDDVFLTYHHTLDSIPVQGFRWQNNSNAGERRLHKMIEVYGWHGSSEYRDNPYLIHGASSKQLDPSYESSMREGLQKGYRLGIVAGTDNHFGGGYGITGTRFFYPYNGITAIYAKNLTVDGIWDALKNRRTYGTTNARAIIEFKTSNGYMMGSRTFMRNITLSVRVVGTGTIDTIVIMRNGTDQVYTYSGTSFDERFNWTDTNVSNRSLYSYYLWFNQTDGVTYGWASPIWITKVPYSLVTNNTLRREKIIEWTKTHKKYNLSCPAGTQLNFTINDTGWNGGDKIIVYHNGTYDNIVTVSSNQIKYTGIGCSTWQFTLFNATMSSPTNTTYTQNYSIDLNTTYTTNVNVTYSWDSQTNITGCQNCTSYNTTYGEWYNSSENNISLVLHMNENTSTSVTDDSGNSNIGVISGPSWTSGKFRYGLSFDGVADSVQINYTNSLNFSDAITVSFWFNISGTTGLNQFIISQGESNTETSFSLLYEDATTDGLVLNFKNSSGTKLRIISTSKISRNRLYHAVGTYDSTTGEGRLYIDGILNKTGSLQASKLKTSAMYNVTIGEKYNLNILWFNGTADEVLLFNRVLTASEIHSLYNKSLSEGQHNVTLYPSVSGTTESAVQYFSIDTLGAPYQVTQNYPLNLTYGTSTINFNWTAADKSTVMRSNLTIDGIVNQSSIITNNGTFTNYSISGLSEGLHNWSVTVWDSANNTNTSSTIEFTVDTISPYQLTLNSPVAYYNSSNQSIVFNWTCYDATDISLSSNLSIDGVVNVSAISTINATATIQQVNNISEANYNWSITCYDSANNTNTSSDRNFTVDLTAPTFLNDQPPSAIGGVSVNITIDVVDALTSISGVNATATFPSGAVRTYTMSLQANNTYYFTTSEADMTDGTITVNVSANDTAGNSASTSFTVPIPKSSGPSGGGSGGGTGGLPSSKEINYSIVIESRTTENISGYIVIYSDYSYAVKRDIQYTLLDNDRWLDYGTWEDIQIEKDYNKFPFELGNFSFIGTATLKIYSVKDGAGDKVSFEVTPPVMTEEESLKDELMNISMPELNITVKLKEVKENIISKLYGIEGNTTLLNVIGVGFTAGEIYDMFDSPLFNIKGFEISTLKALFFLLVLGGVYLFLANREQILLYIGALLVIFLYPIFGLKIILFAGVLFLVYLYMIETKDILVSVLYGIGIPAMIFGWLMGFRKFYLAGGNSIIIYLTGTIFMIYLIWRLTYLFKSSLISEK